MNIDRMIYLYGNEPPLYYYSVCLLCFGLGYNYANYSNWGFSFFFGNTLVLFIGIQIMDALIKGVKKIKKDFKVSITPR